MTAVPLGSQIKLDLKESFQNEVDCDDKMILWVGVLMISQGFPCGSAGEESTCNVGDLGLIHGLGRSPGDLLKISWRRERLPTPVFRAGEFHRLYCLWGQRVRHDWATFTFCHYKPIATIGKIWKEKTKRHSHQNNPEWPSKDGWMNRDEPWVDNSLWWVMKTGSGVGRCLILSSLYIYICFL